MDNNMEENLTPTYDIPVDREAQLEKLMSDLSFVPDKTTPFIHHGAKPIKPYEIPSELRDWILSVSGANQLRTRVIRKTYSDFSTAGTSKDVNLLYLPRYCEIVSCWMNVKTAFAGGAIATYTISVGPDTTETTLLTAQSAASTGIKKTQGTDFTTGRPIYSTSGNTLIQAQAVSTGANLNAATAGVVDFFITYYQYGTANY